MIAMNSSTKLLAVFLCGAALASCRAVEDADDSPVYPNPAVTVAITGKVSGLSRLRPVFLEIETQAPTQTQSVKRALDPIRDTDDLNFGAVTIGSTYKIRVVESPYGRDCYAVDASGARVPFISGTAAADVNSVRIKCDPTNIPRFRLSANINSTLAANRPKDFAVTLTTEEGSETIYPAANQTQVTFTLPIFYPGGNNPPAFTYSVTSTNTENGLVNNCSVTNGTGQLITGSSNITNPNVTGCLYTVSASVSYSPTPVCTASTTANTPNTNCATTIPAGPALAIGAGGVKLGLRSQVTGEVVSQTPLVVTTADTTPFAGVAFPGSFPSNSQALYEVFVEAHPTGQFCITAQTPVANNSAVIVPTGTNTNTIVAQINAQNASGGKVNLVTNLANAIVHIRCRNIPAAANQLKGVYQLDTPPINVSSGADLADNREYQRRDFLTFFPNGTFLFGTHPSEAAAGVEHGFYNYDPVARTLQFTVHTDTNTVNPYGGANGVTAAFNAGLSGRAGYSVSGSQQVQLGAVTAIDVVRTPGAVGTPGKLSLTFGRAITTAGGSTNPVYRVPTWTLTEPRQTLGQIQGAWTTADSLRVFVYDDITFYGFHAGMNGAPNLQDQCLIILDPKLASSYFTRRGGGTYCMTYDVFGFGGPSQPDSRTGAVIVSLVDVPSAASSAASPSITNSTAYYIPGFRGRLPGTQSSQVSTPSPVDYTVTPGSPDTLTIQATLNGTPIEDPVTFSRMTSY